MYFCFAKYSNNLYATCTSVTLKMEEVCSSEISVSTYDLHNIKTLPDYRLVKVNKISSILMLRVMTHTWVVSERSTCSYKHKLKKKKTCTKHYTKLFHTVIKLRSLNAITTHTQTVHTEVNQPKSRAHFVYV
jgi:Ni/Fe-hydrogenase subunit HybB-like protein